MDFLVFLLCVSTISVSFLVLKLIRTTTTTTTNKKNQKLPPGPACARLITSLLLRRASLSDIETLLRDLRVRFGPVISLQITSSPDIFFLDRSLAHRALIQLGPVFADRPPAIPTSSLMNSNQHTVSSAPYGPLWRLLRRNLSAEILHPSRAKSFAPARRRVLRILLDGLTAQAEAREGVAVVIDAFRFAMFCLLVFMCFGDSLADEVVRDIEVVQTDLLLSFQKLNVFAFFPTAVAKLLFRGRWNYLLAISERMDSIFLPLIRSRAQAKHDPTKYSSSVHAYVDSLLELQLPEDGGRKLSEDEMVSLCAEFLTGGTDTTATSLQWIMARLVMQPEIQQKLSDEITRVVGTEAEEVEEEHLQHMPYLKAVILEGLRRHPPGRFVLPHAVTEDVILDGHLIPKRSSINFAVGEIGRDESVWTQPMEFKPERFLPGGEGEDVDITGTREIKMMPFGAGRRICPGLNLAMLHLEYFIANLVREFEWKTVDREEVDLSEKLGFTVMMKNPLRAQILPRRNKC